MTSDTWLWNITDRCSSQSNIINKHTKCFKLECFSWILTILADLTMAKSTMTNMTNVPCLGETDADHECAAHLPNSLQMLSRIS